MSWQDYKDDPRAPWCRHGHGLFALPFGNVGDDVGQLKLGVCSASFDSTASTRIGARNGPAAIRDASQGLVMQAQGRAVALLHDARWGEDVRLREVSGIDFGDCHVYPVDVERQIACLAAEVEAIARTASVVLVLGGEHTITAGTFAGVLRAESRRRLGYLHIDHHFDFGDSSQLHGRLYHGSNSRRISELSGMSLGRMAFFGQGDITSQSQLAMLRSQSAGVTTLAEIRRHGLLRSLEAAATRLMESCDAMYVSVDVDVCAAESLPGTGHVSIGGLNLAEFIDVARLLRRWPVVALDVVELNPSLDPTGRSSTAVARFLFEWLFLEGI